MKHEYKDKKDRNMFCTPWMHLSIPFKNQYEKHYLYDKYIITIYIYFFFFLVHQSKEFIKYYAKLINLFTLPFHLSPSKNIKMKLE